MAGKEIRSPRNARTSRALSLNQCTCCFSPFQIICHQEHHADGEPERRFEPISCLKRLECRNSKEKHEEGKVSTELYSFIDTSLNGQLDRRNYQRRKQTVMPLLPFWLPVRSARGSGSLLRLLFQALRRVRPGLVSA
jgi:hypothetical protein